VVPPLVVEPLSMRAPVDFSYDSLDERPVSSQAARGRPAVLVFVQVGSIASQAQVNFLVAMARNDGDRVAYFAVALEPREHRELVELYARTLHIPFPVALADAATLRGTGVFGPLETMPAVIVLDRSGRVSWRSDGGVVPSTELRARLRGL
jgi:hypothetical protein